MVNADSQLIRKVLERGVEKIIERTHLEAALNSGRKLRVKLGIDPTAPDLHLGHTVILRKLRQFQNLGHQIILIIGDFTATIGDPSGRSEERKPLSAAAVKKNMERFLEQAGKVIDVKKTEVRYNSEWHKKEGLATILELGRAASIQQVLKRADFQKRLAEGSDVSLLEILYPVFQGYDSVKVKADVELGGTDQEFNLLMGRRVQRHFKMPEQDIVLLPLIEGTDGVRKMSKSYGNYIGLNEKPNEMFGKIMSIPDSLIQKYFITLTDVDPPKNLGPYQSKLFLAEAVVGIHHSPALAKKARENFINVFSKKEKPTEVPQSSVSAKELSIRDITWLVVNIDKVSKSQAWRLIKGGAVKINNKTITNPKEMLANTEIGNNKIVRIGKHNFFKIRIK